MEFLEVDCGGFDDMARMMQAADCACIIVPAGTKAGALPDAKLACEIGVVVFLGKRVILAVGPGACVSDKLAAFADRIVELTGNAKADGPALDAAVRDMQRETRRGKR